MREWSNTLRKFYLGIAMTSFLVFAGDFGATAQESAKALPVLDEQILSRFAETWKPITDAISAQDKEFDSAHVPSLVHSLNGLAASDGAQSLLDEVVSHYSYGDFEQWATIAQRCIEAAQWAAQPPTESELKRTIMALQSDPDIAEDQKQSLVNDVSAAYQAALDNKPLDADIAAAKAVLPLLEPIIKPDQ